ncbi:MAG: FAD-binding oxidoreductase [Desulfobacterales bacterium]|nr:MAG: FAD-binding oxidoreductase [Desulfobacterales bacterium]
MNAHCDALIIGAGIIGAAVGFELAKAGYKTLNVDKRPAAGCGSTGNSCAVIRTHYSTWDGTAMAYESLFHWQDWQNYLGAPDERGYPRYINTGCVIIKSNHYDAAQGFRYFRELGIAYEEWDLLTLKAKLPLFDPHAFWPPRRPEDDRFWDTPTEKISGAIFVPSSGYVSDPQLATHNLQRAAEAQGGQFRFNCEVVKIRRAGGRVLGVTLQNGEQIDAPVVVNVAGPHSFVINRLAGVEADMRIKTRALRHEVHFVPAPEGFDYENNGYICSDGDIGCYSRPEVGNHILIGSEDPECDPRQWIDDPDDFNREVTLEQWTAQVYRFARRVPSLGIPQDPAGIVDLYDVSDDWIPIYDKSDLDGFYMAVGTSGNQFKNAPVVGYLMARLIHACQSGHDHDQEPVKIQCRYTGLTLNAGFYSRRRAINPESSFSVLG